ncbi:hypothetical protein [Actinoalloteichus hymeniacidonis]|uniref:Methyltransferase FkbM domain n=1 Tax=Actinoalloteichus hymeniacidonis TaxID=340345 RepID=A0AAC9MY93_9PSEU|nr:hypothetical protein [Actinoalloteichus hymeniacidonis]AOS64168.1 Methyltransferase FkbM domain [Actinoalloteichus hymeniacidonis]MBB5907765.1 hypothetical protein [Actinoalloteichus hymeniacidonis]
MFTEADLARRARVYAALPEYRRRLLAVDPLPGAFVGSAGLTDHEFQLFSQNGEDGVLLEILRRVGVTDGSFVEFGVETGREGNCIALADVAGWRGLFLEGDGAHNHHLHQKYQWNNRVRTLHAMVTPDRIEELFRLGEVPAEPDVVSIDIDGGDYWVWEALTRFHPRVVVIEYNSALDPNRAFVQPRDTPPWDGTAFFGASLGALVALGERKGYRLVHCELAGVNAFFVRADQAGEFPAPAEVQRRGPNYFLTSHGHPADHAGRAYVEL